jgi:hypothetical protein
MSMQDAIAGAAEALEAEMVDTCVVERDNPGPGTFDPDTYRSVIGRTTVYRGHCYLGDRIEGAWTSGGFGSNPQPWAIDARTHNSFVRLPLGTKPELVTEGDPANARVGDFVTFLTGNAAGETYQIQGRELGTSMTSRGWRIVKFDVEASRA